MKECTCAIAYSDGNKILVCHPTGAKPVGCFSLPKGKVEPFETLKQAAVRELYEETSLIVNEDDLIFIDRFKYTKEKDYALFLYKAQSLPNLKDLKCISFFKSSLGRETKEVDFFSFITINDIYNLNKNQAKIIDENKSLLFYK